MSYRALYRVWRPQRFDELVGQGVIARTLENTITTNQISHAYLFTGPRGTGKTSTAKIFAKAINCPHAKHGEPCNKCKMCKAITNGDLNDVVEIDAASNNGVDEIRNVRDKAHYAPTQAKYKVYIIDEVHMLSIGAFNALLKTLEEPPAHVIFIMATTEPQKVPATIISRVQRFNFKRIQPQDILHRMEYILHREHDIYDVRALKVIAKAAEGGMRDALSILDEVLSYGKDKITYQDALAVTGNVTKTLLYKYTNEITHHNVKSALVDVQKILASGKDANQFVESLINYCQDILLYQQSPKVMMKTELGIVSENFAKLAKQTKPNLVYAIITQLNEIEEQMRFTIHPDVYLEVLTIRIANLEPNQTREQKEIKQLTQQMNDLKSKLIDLERNGISAKPKQKSRRINQKNSNDKSQIDMGAVTPILRSATRSDLDRIRKAWPHVIASLPRTKLAMMDISKPVAVSDSGMIISFAYKFFYIEASRDTEVINTLKKNLVKIMKCKPTLVFMSEKQWKKIRHDFYAKN